MSREAGRSRGGSRAGWAAVSVAEGTPRPCRSDLWDQVGSAKVSGAASAEVSGAASVAVTEATEASVAATMAAAEAASVEASVAAGAATATSAAAGVVIAVDRTVTLLRTLPTDPAAVTAVTGETSPAPAVGMAVTVVVAHMMTGPEATEATVAAETGAATGALGRREATWSQCGHAEITGTAEVETTTVPEMTTRASVATKAATRIRGSCDATDRTIPKECLVVGISDRSPHLSVSDYCFTFIFSLCHQG